MGLEIPVLYKLYGEYLTRLDQLIMVSDMAKQSLRTKQEGIEHDGSYPKAQAWQKH